ncbi:MAG: flagellar basal body-associated FliL family protein [Pirellulaceae bacterium]|nr:flagellar basal body-associated FliL family protein [Pirellulaceae bacterium]
MPHMIKPLLVSVFVAIVILTECMFAYFLIPSSSDVEAWAKEKAQHATTAASTEHGEATENGHAAGDPHAAHQPGEHEVEIELGKYNIVIHQPAANLTMRVNFHLIGTLPEKELASFETLFHHNEHRLRDQVIFEIRNSRVEDLVDPGLALLKRKILAKSNELLGQPVLRAVLFSDFSFIEQ